MRRIAWGRIAIIVALVLVTLVFVRVTETADHEYEQVRDPHVYALIGSTAIERSDVERSYAQRSADQADLSLEEYFDTAYAPRMLLLIEARSEGITVSDEEVDVWIMIINSSLQSQNASFDEYLEDLDRSYEELREDIRSSMLLEKALDRFVAEQVMVTAQEVQEAYDAAGYAALNITLEEARNEIGPRILREKQEARLHEVLAELRERYDVRIV